jgi:two pore calcium channel protein
MPSDPSDVELRKADGIRKAAWILEDAVFGIECAKYPTTPEARTFHLKVQRAEKLYEWALLGLVVLSFSETPTWCDAKHGWSWLEGPERCHPPDLHQSHCEAKAGPDKCPKMFLSGFSYLPPNAGIVVELACMAVVLRKFLLQWERETRFFRRLEVQYMDHREIKFGVFIVFLGFLDCAVYAIFKNTYRIVLVTRSGLLMMLPSVRNLTRVAVNVIVDVSFIMVALAGAILMFAWVAVMIFNDEKDKENVNGIRDDPVNAGFENFGQAVYSMFLASVTEESFIDRFLPTFTKYRISGLLWLVFLVIVHLLLLNLVLDTLVAGYASVSEERTRNSAKNQAAGVLKAFAECESTSPDNGRLKEEAYEPTMKKEGFLQLLQELGKSPYLGTFNEKISLAFFDAVDSDTSGEIDQKEFIEICKVMNFEFQVTSYHSFLQRYPLVWESHLHTWFRDFYERDRFDMVMNIVLCVNFLLIIYESWFDLTDRTEPWILGNVEFVFSIIYVLEMVAKLTVISWAQYWALSANKFDFWTTIILLLNSVLSVFPWVDKFLHFDFSKYANLLRVLRLLRVLKTVKRLEEVKFLAATIIKIVNLSRDIMTLLSVIIFIFSQVSVQLFGGLLYQGNPKLKGTEYEEKEWYVLNYNDLLMAFAVYFVSLLVEFEPVFAEVLGKIERTQFQWTITLFYYLAACAVVFELVQAFTIETFVELWNKHRDSLKKQKERAGAIARKKSSNFSSPGGSGDGGSEIDADAADEDNGELAQHHRREALRKLKVSELMKLARENSATTSEIEGAMDDVDQTQALINLICAKEEEVEKGGDSDEDEDDVFHGYKTVEKFFKEKSPSERIHCRVITSRSEKWDEALSEAFEELFREADEKELEIWERGISEASAYSSADGRVQNPSNLAGVSSETPLLVDSDSVQRAHSLTGLERSYSLGGRRKLSYNVEEVDATRQTHRGKNLNPFLHKADRYMSDPH